MFVMLFSINSTDPVMSLLITAAFRNVNDSHRQSPNDNEPPVITNSDDNKITAGDAGTMSHSLRHSAPESDSRISEKLQSPPDALP
jgi:hypothetical protein